MAPLKQIPVKTTAAITTRNDIAKIIACPDGGILVQQIKAPNVIRYDPQFNIQWQKNLGEQDQGERFDLAISTDGNYITTSGTERTCIYDGQGNLLHQQHHHPWRDNQSSGCYVSPVDSVGDRHIWYFRPASDNDGYLEVLDLSDFTLVDSMYIDDISYHFHFFPTPDKDKLLIELAAGQDGTQLWEAQLVDQKIQLTNHLVARYDLIGSISETKSEILFLPMMTDDLKIYSFPDLRQLIGFDQSRLFAPLDDFPGANVDRLSYPAHYASSDIIIVHTRFGRILLLDRRAMQFTAELLLEGNYINAYDYKDQLQSDITQIMDFKSDIIQLILTPKNQLILQSTAKTIKIYDIAPAVYPLIQ